MGTQRRRRQLRLKEYNYSEGGAYFITICSKNKEHLFGRITNGEMYINELGTIARECWQDLPKHYSDIELDAFVVMSNHIHGIIMIHDVGAIHELPLPHTRGERRRMLLPKIIGRFKMNSARRINEIRRTAGAPVWQRNYFEHIIRSEKSLHRIQAYIQTNPMRWTLDKENAEGIGSDEFEVWITTEGTVDILGSQE